jgi:tetratricopeptide (TPR) repeat protein
MTERATSELLEAADEALVQAGFCTGNFNGARALVRAARARAVRDGDEALEAAAADRLGMMNHYLNITRRMAGLELDAADMDAEEELFRHALTIRERRGNLTGVAQSMFGLGLVFQVLRRDWRSGMPFLWRALAIVDDLQTPGVDLYTHSEIHRNIGFYFAVEELRPKEAVRHLQRSLDLREELGDLRRLPSGLEALGEAELAAGNPGRAVELLRRAVAIGRQAGLLVARIEETERVSHEAEAALTGQQE